MTRSLQNTPESFKKAQDVVKNARAAGSPLSRRAVLFFSALSLKQRSPDTALESLSMTFMNLTPPRPGRPGSAPLRLPPGDTRYIPIIGKINLATLSLAKMDRVDDALVHLRSAVQDDRPFKEGCVLQETVSERRSLATARPDCIASRS